MYMRKGINTFLGEIFLIAIVMVVAVIMMNFSSGLIKTKGASIENKTMECSDADVSIMETYLDIGAGRARVAVKNSGLSDGTLKSGVLLNTRGDNSPNLTAFPVSFPVGSLNIIEFNITGKIGECGNFSKVIISSSCASDESNKMPKCS